MRPQLSLMQKMKQFIQASINELVQGKTLIVNAHRLSTITAADKILVMNNGRVEAEGTHDALLKGWSALSGTVGGAY